MTQPHVYPAQNKVPPIPAAATLAQMGQEAWAEFHAAAKRFHERVGDECGCGEHAEQAVRGWHDAVNVSLGKPVQYPEALRGFAQFLADAVKQHEAHSRPPPRDILGNPDLDRAADEQEEEGERERRTRAAFRLLPVTATVEQAERLLRLASDLDWNDGKLPPDLEGLVEEIDLRTALGDGIDDQDIKLTAEEHNRIGLAALWKAAAHAQ